MLQYDHRHRINLMKAHQTRRSLIAMGAIDREHAMTLTEILRSLHCPIKTTSIRNGVGTNAHHNRVVYALNQCRLAHLCEEAVSPTGQGSPNLYWVNV